MKKVFMLLWLWASTFYLYAQNNINYLEYFWNSDPGWGMATSVSITPNDTIDVSFSPITAGLIPGVNVLYVRAKDDSLKWTFPIQKTIYFYPDVPSNSQKIEYYIDTDPGLNNGIAVLTTGDSLIDQTFNIDLNSVSHGLHLIGLRMRDQYGFWSITRTHLFYKYLNSGDNIVQLEYFFDSDPGLGLGTQIPITASDSIDIVANIDLTGILQGHHRLFIRAKSANGFWTFTAKHEFFMVGQNVVKLEYFWNNDPGVNMATNVPITTGPVVDVTFSPLTTGLKQGFNILYVRAKNEGNIWSMPVQKSIFFTVNAQQNASELEYFIDTDPGLGLGTQIPVTNDDSISVTFNVNLQNVTPGLHRLFVRGKDKFGYWGNTAIHSFFRAVDGSSQIVQLEYFIDNDPGIGNAANIPITPGDTLDVTFMPDLSLVSEGIHSIFVRGKASDGKWSFTQRQAFFKINNNPDSTILSDLEYYFDVDPGYGNGTALPGTPADTIDMALPVSLSGLSVGTHKLHIRAKDNGNHWSHIWAGNITVTETDNLFPVISTYPTSINLSAANCITPDTSGFYIINSGSNSLNANISESLSWLTISPLQVGVPAGDSVWISAIATPSSSLPATNVGTIAITNNSQNAPTLNRSVTFNVPQGVFSMMVSHDTLTLPTVQVNQIASGSILLHNTGCSSITVDSVRYTSNNFFHTIPSFVIGSGINHLFNINFESPTIGIYIDTMYIYSQAGIDTVIVHAEAVGVPLLAFETDTLSVDFMMCAVDTLLTQKIYNNGDGPLHYQVTNFSGLPSFISIINATDTVAVNDSTVIIVQLENVTLPNGIYHYPIILSTNDTIHFLDTFIISIAVMGQAMLTTSVSTLSFGPIPRNTLQVKPITITNSGCQPIYISNVTTGTGNFIDNISSIYLPPYQSYTANVRFQPPLTGAYTDTLTIIGDVDTAYVVLQGTASGALTFELESFASNVTIQNCMGMTMDTITLYNVGDGDGSFNISNATSFPSWLEVSPLTGSISEGDSIDLILSYDAMALHNALYSQNIIINTSDPITPNVTLLANMFIVGAPMATLDKDTIDYGFTYWTTTKMDSITITNTGCDTFEIKSINIAVPFLVTPSVLNILPGGTGKIFVTYDPAAIGNDNYIMQINAETDTIEVVLMGDAVEYPTITKATRDTLTITMPAPIDAGTLNTNTMVVWGEQSGKRTGTYSVSGNDINFIPTQNFFAGEEFNTALTQSIKYTNGENIQRYSLKSFTKIDCASNAEFIIKPTALICPGCALFPNDFNKNDTIDLVGFNSNSLLSIKNLGNSNFTINSTQNSSGGFVKFGDFNNNGNNDLLMRTINQLIVFENNVNGSFSQIHSRGFSYPQFGSTGVLACDVNSDGWIDQIDLTWTNGTPFASPSYLNIRYFQNILGNSFIQKYSLNYTSGHQFFKLQPGDFNKNGLPEIIFGNNNSSVAYEIQDEKLKYVYSTPISGGSILDVNNDEVLELMYNSGTETRIYSNTISSPLSGSNYLALSDATGLISGDFDGDGDYDIIFRGNTSKALGVGLNDGSGNFIRKEMGFNINNASIISSADLDNDGDLDFAFIDAQGKLWIAYNEDNTAEMSLSQYTISDTLMCGDSITVPISIRNTGTSPLVWQQDAATASPSGAGYQGVSGATWLSSSSQYSEIPAGDSLVLNLKIKTTGLTNGNYNFQYIINSNDSENYKDTVAISFVVQTDSNITINPVAWDFGLVDTAKVYTKNIVINNSSCQSITIAGNFMVGGQYTVIGLTPATIPAFSSRTLTLSLNPNTLTSYADTLVLTHSYGVQAIPLAAQGCYVSPVTQIYEQVCRIDSVGVDSTLLMNVSGCDSLVVTYYFLPGLDQQDLKLAMFFNGNANDLSGNNNHGVVTGATLTTDRFGNENSAYRFFNNGDKIVIPNIPSVSGTNKRAISFWLKHEGIVGGIFTWGNYSNCNEFAMSHFSSTPNLYRLQFWACDHDVSLPNSNVGWHHYVLQYENSNVQLYYDGVLITTIARSLNTTNTNITLGLRASQDVSIKASLDDILIYNKYLSPSEVLNLYNSQNSSFYNNSPVYTYSQSCEPLNVGLDTTILAGANQYGCDSTIITLTSLHSPVSNEGLVAYYSFDGNAQDISGWGRNGIVNGATLTTDRQGKPNGAYSFDGVNDMVQINNPYYQFEKEITVSWWVNASSFTNASGLGQSTYNVDNMNTNVWLMHANSSNVMGWYVNDNGTWRTTQTNALLPGWHHIVGTVKGDSIRIYVDGIYHNKAVGITTQIRRNLNSSIVIGRDPRIPSNRWLNGKIDQVQIYNKALNISEIQALYNEQQSYFINAFTTCDTTALGVDTTTYIGPNGCEVTDININSLQSPISNQGLVAYYKLDGDVKDGSGYGNNGTLFGAVSSNDRWDQSSSSLYFDGVNDYAEVNNNDALNSYLTTGELSISYWIKPDIGSTTRDLIAKRPITDNGGFIVQANANQMGYDHVIFTNSGSKYVVIPYTQNQWQHISFTAKQNDAIRVYKNGVLAGSLSLAGNTFVGTSANMRLMANTMALEFFQKGNLDEVMIHNRVLSPSEIISLYNQHLTYAQSCDIADIGRDTIVMSSSTACDSIQNIVTSLQSSISSQDLVAYYSFDGNANDMSGWGNHGTVNGATLTTDRDGNVNSAYSFDENDEIISPAANHVFNNLITMSVWVYPTAHDNGYLPYFSKNNSTGQGLYDFISEINGGPKTYVKFNGKQYIFNFSPTLNNWTQLSATCDNVNASLFVNGLLHSTVTSSSNYTFDSNQPFVIGANTQGLKETFRGSLDQIFIYKRVLSEAEIQALYQSSSFLYTNTISSCDPIDVGQDTTYFAGGSNGCDSTVVTITSLHSPVINGGLAAYYTMDGNANDFSGYGRNATITGATLIQDRHGNTNSAYAFNGSNQYLSTHHDANLNPGSSSYGVSLHFKTAATGQRELLMKTSLGTQEFVSVQQNGGNIIAQLVKGSTTYTCSTTGLTLNDNVWHHVFFQRAPGTIKDTLRLYIDGELKKQEIYGSVLSVQPQEKMYIGIRKNWNGGGLQFSFLGDIDGVMVWNRTLSLVEIQSLAYERKGGPQTLVQRDTTYDYGIVMVGEAPVFSTFITNTSCDTLTINNIHTTNSAFTSNTTASSILPYASQKIEVSFTPTAEVPYAGELKVESAGDTLTYYLTGNGCNLCACPTEDVVLTTQNGLDAFVAYYGGCDSLPVSLTLAGTSGITNINGLNFIKHIDGNLTINGHTALTNINGFGNLLGLTGSLTVTNNTLISHIDSLHELSYIGQSLIIQNNNGLSNLFGLRNVDSIGQHITITNNAALNDCDAICPAWNNGISGNLTIANNPSECSTVTQFKMVCDDDCTIGNLILTTQAEVNTFVSTYHTCDTLIGNLTISGGSNINNIHGLSFIKQISGNLTLSGNTNLINMKGLQGLIKLTGNLTITGHPNLVSLDSLHHLAVVSGTLSIQNNPVLNEINALSSLDTIGGNLNINNNITLYNCSGVCNVINNDAILGNINIVNNPNNCSTTEEVTIYCTPPVCPVSGDYTLKNQAEVNAFVSSFSICDSLIGNLTILGGNDILNIDGLNFIKYISGNLTIKNNYKITNMQGFSNLQKVGGLLSVEGNILVNSLAHLDSLTYVGGLLRIQNNNALPNLNGLQYLVHIGQNLIVRNNNVLTNCSVICTLIANNVINGVIDVASNPSPCNNNNQVNTVCTYGSLLSTVFVTITQDSIAEGSTFTFVVSTDYPPSDTLTIHLSSNNQTDVPVPATVKILPNTTSVNVTLTLPNDNIPEKEKAIIITGGAPYLTSGSDSFILTDNADMPAINLVITLDTISEGAGLFATPAIISRAFTDGTTMNITLTSSHPALTILPTGVNLAPNELQKQIFIGVADNVNVDTLRKVTITARYIIPSCVCPAPDNSQGVARDILYVSDDDGPTLTISVNPLSMEEGKVNAGTLTISRNTATNVPLTVNLSHNDPTELSLPATATFPIGASSINVTITTLNDPIEDGNQTVTITVSAPGFVSATTWAIVTDINKPDLVITSLESLDPQLTLGEQMPYKVYIHNKGLSASARGIAIVGYLSKDGSISNDDLLLGNYFMDIAIPAGDTVVFGGTGNLPTTHGTYYLIFRVNPNQTITELLYLNNTSAPLQINVLPNYTATANVNKAVYYIGEPVIISGSSFDLQGQKLPNKAVEIYVLTGNHRREIDVVTNAQGDYIYTLQHLQSEMGHFTVGASYPDLGLTTAQDAYNILGVRLNNGNFITWNMMLGDTINGNLSVRNLAQVTINNVTLSPQNLPNGCILTFDTLATLQGNATQFLPYRVIAGALTQGTEYIQIPLNIHANDTIIQKDRAYYFVKAQTGHLKASITNINTQLGPIAKKVIEFEIENIGQGAISQVNFSLPNVTWLRLVSAPQITNMLSGQKRIVTLEFIPTTQLPFNTPATGNIAINTTNANGISIPFSVMKVGDMTGSMTIDVINQFTYFSPGAPHLDSARVRITNYFTGQLYAEGLTGTDGKFVANNLPEGQLRIVVDKIRHKSYDGVINVSPGTNQTEVVFLEFQAISFSWDVTATEIEDEYEIDLIMNFESNIPVPVVTMVMPDTLPKLIGDQTFAFNITMTNVGLITAKEVQLDLPDDIEYEFITTYQPQDILAQQAIQVPVVVRRRSTGGNFNGEDEVQNRIKVNENVIREAEQRLNFKKN